MTAETLKPRNSYDPNRLLDALKDLLKLDSDVALSRVLDVPPPLISQIRHRGYPVGPSILIRMHDVSMLSVRELREIMGDRRKQVRTGDHEAYIVAAGAKRSVGTERSSASRRHLYIIAALAAFYLLWLLGR